MIDTLDTKPMAAQIATAELTSVLPDSLRRHDHTRERDEQIAQTRTLLFKMRAEAVIRPETGIKYAERLSDELINDSQFIEQVIDENEKMTHDKGEPIINNPNSDIRDISVLLRHAHEIHMGKVELKNTLKGNYTDPIAGSRNQKYAEEIVPFRVEEATFSGRNVARVMIDLDRFKQVNDDLGHDMGDRVLRTVAQAAQSCLRDSDIFARSGGDEFTGVLFDTNAEDAVHVAQKIQAAVREATRAIGLHLDATEIYPESNSLTISVGIALNNGEEVTDHELKTNSDKAVYVTKRAGRNGVTVYDPTTMTSVDVTKPISR